MNICLIFANKDCLPCRKTSSHIYCLHVRVHTGMNTCAYMQMHTGMCVCVEDTGWQWVYISVILYVCVWVFFLSQDLSLNLELAKSARLACSQAQGTRCLWSPSTVITGISCSTHFFQCMFHGMEHLPSCLCVMQHVTELSQSQELCFLMRTIPMSLLILCYTVEWNWCISAFLFYLHFHLLFNLFIPSLLPSLWSTCTSLHFLAWFTVPLSMFLARQWACCFYCDKSQPYIGVSCSITPQIPPSDVISSYF